MAKTSASAAAPTSVQFPTGAQIKINPNHAQAQMSLEAILGIGVNRADQQSARQPRSVQFDATAEESGPVDHSNILGSSISEKIRKGSLTGEPCIRVYVEKKVDPAAIEPGSAIPPVIDGIPTDVVETGAISFLAVNEGDFRRPVPCGIGIAAATPGVREVGTLGARCVVENSWAILSNNHVLALNDRLPVGTHIVQPGVGADPTKAIAVLHRVIPLSTTSENVVDAGVALTGVQYASGQFVSSFTLNPSPVTPFQGQAVRKDGYMTGTTRGQIVAVNVRIPIRAADGRSFFFVDQLEIQGTGSQFSAGGDSGSLVVEEGSFRPVALLFAGNGTFTFATPIQTVMQALGIQRFG